MLNWSVSRELLCCCFLATSAVLVNRLLSISDDFTSLAEFDLRCRSKEICNGTENEKVAVSISGLVI